MLLAIDALVRFFEELLVSGRRREQHDRATRS